MEQQQAQQIEQQLRQNWQQVRQQILEQFAQVSPWDLDFARNINDLVERIVDKSHHSDRYVERRLLELIDVEGIATRPQGQPFGAAIWGSRADSSKAGSRPVSGAVSNAAAYTPSTK
ncbi:hypothetical protein [Nonomuraea diastatica]|uniref:hypothetical protein n=1 Tax=Nonomuraea diastatica TaxID=1848329 RepID=UPI0015F2C762|nr:hypothetical protein [Nonomuraea diastatica]